MPPASGGFRRVSGTGGDGAVDPATGLRGNGLPDQRDGRVADRMQRLPATECPEEILQPAKNQGERGRIPKEC